MKARILTKENISQMRRSALAMIAKSEYLEYRSKQMELINDIASVVHVFGLNSCVRTVWSMDHSFEDLSLHLGYNKPSDKLKLDPDASVIYIFWDRYSCYTVEEPRGACLIHESANYELDKKGKFATLGLAAQCIVDCCQQLADIIFEQYEF